MTFADFDWLDKLPDYEDGTFGYARTELQAAENTFKPDMPDHVLLRMYSFLVSREQDHVWEVLRDLVEGLLYLRMIGPRWCPREYAGGFDPEDHAKALEAVKAGTLPNKDLVTLYFQAETHSRDFSRPDDVSEFADGWTPIFPLARDQILARMATGRSIILSTVPTSICFLQNGSDQSQSQKGPA